jgi:hypothetical protein
MNALNRSVATSATADKAEGLTGEPWLAETLRHVRETQFGQVTLTIHQGEVVEVQKTEKRRFNRPHKDS